MNEKGNALNLMNFSLSLTKICSQKCKILLKDPSEFNKNDIECLSYFPMRIIY